MVGLGDLILLIVVLVVLHSAYKYAKEEFPELLEWMKPKAGKTKR